MAKAQNNEKLRLRPNTLAFSRPLFFTYWLLAILLAVLNAFYVWLIIKSRKLHFSANFQIHTYISNKNTIMDILGKTFLYRFRYNGLKRGCQPIVKTIGKMTCQAVFDSDWLKNNSSIDKSQVLPVTYVLTFKYVPGHKLHCI